MKTSVNANDPRLATWVDVPRDSDFPIQNLPFGVFTTPGGTPRAGVAIGESILDLAYLQDKGYFRALNLPPRLFHQPNLNAFLALGRKTIRGVRHRVSHLLSRENAELQSRKSHREQALIPQRRARMLLPVQVANYTDFYSSEEHAVNVGSIFRDPENPLLPNWKHLPVGYHGRASSIVVSGTSIRRPRGQLKPAAQVTPELAPTQKLDFELELAFITCAENKLGQPIPVARAEDFIAGFVLFNDWSARDIQQWEYVPLGPFLGKNFASTISPWMVTLDALEPFRVGGPTQSPPPQPYLTLSGKRNFDVALEVFLRTASGAEAVLCRTNAKYLYWNVSQQLAHHTVNGCNVQVGDLYASGTISGPSPGSFGSLLELSWNGQRPLAIPGGTERRFLEDGDTVIMKAYAERDGVRVGFGECTGTIISALP